MSKIDPAVLAYEGCDLEAMSQAPNYYRWLTTIIKPYIGQTVVEVGAGSGSFSKQLLALKPAKAIFIEPTKNMFKLLEPTVNAAKQPGTSVTTYNDYMLDVSSKLAAQKPDTFIYVNVFEHIEDDLKELKTIKKLLPSGGHAIIFVPALQSLYSDFDKSIGHYRRYTKQSVTELASQAGMEVISVRYMDALGVVSWWGSFKLMKRKALTPSLIGIYDRFFIPVIRTAETVVTAPIGKNVLLIARKK